MGGFSGETVATKVNPGNGKTLSATSVRHQVDVSLKKLNVPKVDILYLHWPCLDVPIEETLKAVNDLYSEGKFKRFGLSNFISWQVSEIQTICSYKGYVKPTVYQGLYNCITRVVESELMPCLRRYGMAFYCYNPLCGGLLTGKHRKNADTILDGRYTDKLWGKVYQQRFFNDANFDGVDIIAEACRKEEIDVASAALRWMMHHSAMDGSFNDGIIVGASNVNHLTTNLKYLDEGPLPESVVSAIDKANVMAKAFNPNYFRNVTGSFKL